ncbi:MAG: glutamate--tRNA ligase, partial [Terrimesophilobacter sp.]
FDVKKAESINGDHIRLLDVDDFAERMLPYLGGLVTTPAQRELLHKAAPLVQERMQLLGEALGLLEFLFTSDDAITFDKDALPGVGGPSVLAVATNALTALDEWTVVAIEATLRGALIDELGVKPREAFGPLRSAISGRRISPPLFESMELLGKASTLARIARLADRL